MLEKSLSVHPLFGLFSPNKRNNRTAKINGIAPTIYGDLWNIRVENIFVLFKNFNQRGNLNSIVGETGRHLLQLLGLNGRFIALYIHHNIKFSMNGSLN